MKNDANEVQDALGRPYGMPEIDEDDLEAKLDALGDDEEHLVLYDRLINLPSNEIKTEIPIIQEDLVNDEPLLETQEIAEPEIVEPIWPKAEIVKSRVQVNPNDFEKEYTINVKEEQFNKSWFHEISKRDLPEHLKIRCYYVRISFLH